MPFHLQAYRVLPVLKLQVSFLLHTGSFSKYSPKCHGDACARVCNISVHLGQQGRDRIFQTVSTLFHSMIKCLLNTSCNAYSFRMKLVCRPTIALCIHVDKMDGVGFSNSIGIFAFSSALNYFIHCVLETRWKLRMDNVCKPQTSRTRSDAEERQITIRNPQSVETPGDGTLLLFLSMKQDACKR